ncbi:MAG: hypothetical protein WCS52_00165 [bacterium]
MKTATSNMKSNISILAVLGLLACAAGCVSTPDSRIKKDPRLFATLAPEVQAKVKKGEVAIGFSRDMVRLALGLPRQVNVRTSEVGETEIWTYVNSRYVSRYEPSNAGYWYRDRAGRPYHSYDTMWVSRSGFEDYPVLKLEFVGDSLKVIERLKQ